MNYKLDKKDIKIIDTICNNARLSYNQIAKATQISKDRVRERILRLQKELYIISYFPLIDYSKIGLSLFQIYIRLKSIKNLDQDIVNEIKNNKKIVSAMHLMGKYDLELQIIAKNKKQAIQEINKIHLKKKIDDLDIVKSEQLHIYSMDCGDSDIKNKRIIKDDYKQIKLDPIDSNLLNLLSENARYRIIDLAEKLNINEDDIRYRIKKLTKNKAILGFYARTNKHRRNLLTYIMLIKTKNKISKSQIDQLSKLKNLFYFKESKGKWNYIARFHSDSNRTLIEILSNIRTIIESDLENFVILHLLERKKFIPFDFTI